MKMRQQIIVVMSSGLTFLLIVSISSFYYYLNQIETREIDQMKRMLLEERQSHLQSTVQNAYAVLQSVNFYESAQAAIANMRFGDKGQNTFFVIDKSGLFWVNSDRPDLVGKKRNDLKDAQGNMYIKKILAAARNKKDGSVRIIDAKGRGKDPSEKLIYFKPFQKWGWIVCAGIFIDDINEIIEKNQQELNRNSAIVVKKLILLSFGGAISLIFIWSWYFGTRLLKPVFKLKEAADEMASGNLEQEIEIESMHELNQLADALQRMQVSFVILLERLKVIRLQSAMINVSKGSKESEKRKTLEMGMEKKLLRVVS